MINIDIDPILFRWGAVTIEWHGFWILIAVVFAYLAVAYEGQRKNITSHYWSELFVWLVLSGYIGARLVHVLDYWEIYAQQPLAILAVNRGGFGLFGTLIGATLATLIYASIRKLPFWCLMDAIAFGIPIGEIVGRIGCTINGDVWGVPTGGSWGLVYWHPDTVIPDHLLGVPTFPAPTILQILSIGLLAILLVLNKRLHTPGTLFLSCMIVYSVGRFMVSIWQPNELFLLGLKQAQVISIGIIVVSLGILFVFYLPNISPKLRHFFQKHYLE